MDGKKSDHGPETEETLPEIQKQTRDASGQESTEVNEPHELCRAIDLPRPDSSWIDIFCDVATWPHYISQHIRVDMVMKGPLGIQNRYGPFPKNENCSMSGEWFFKKLENGKKNSFATGCSIHLHRTPSIVSAAAYSTVVVAPLPRRRDLTSGGS